MSTALTESWGDALRRGHGAALVDLLGGEPRMTSPFNAWHGRNAAVACLARGRAFENLTVVSLACADGVGWLRWRAGVEQLPEVVVEGVDVLGVDGGSVLSVDVFLRPRGCAGARARRHGPALAAGARRCRNRVTRLLSGRSRRR